MFVPAIPSITTPCCLCRETAFESFFTAEDYEYQLPGTFVVAKCRSCGLLQQNPRPEFADIIRYYPQDYQAFQSQHDSLIDRIHYYTKTVPFMRLIESLVPKEARIVDIGCGNGERLRILQQAGFSNVYGIEPSEAAIQASRQHPINIKHGVLEAGDLPDGSVDLVFMVHVLEHLPDPRDTLYIGGNHS